MKAIAIIPGKGAVHLADFEEPQVKEPNEVKLKVIEVGICGTDREEVAGGRADAPAGEKELIIGHEMLGKVVETGSSVRTVKKGDYAVFMVRRPCNKCPMCHKGRSDMCLTGDYTERGIKGRHGFQSEFVVDSEEFIIPVPSAISDIGVLTEPMSVVEKAIDESFILQSSRLPGISSDNWLKGRKALVAGIGPIGLLACFILKLRGAEIYGLDIVDESSPRPGILKEIGGKYINGKMLNTDKIDDTFGGMDFILEATGIAKLEFQLLDALGLNGIYVLTGIPSGERPITLLGSDLMRQMVLQNQIMFGSVNAAMKHYRDAVADLEKIKSKWEKSISRIITEKVFVNKFTDVLLEHSPEEIKTVISWSNDKH
jgi:threonine dehydrogenase-like Zn-dependent dehydrogenase